MTKRCADKTSPAASVDIPVADPQVTVVLPNQRRHKATRPAQEQPTAAGVEAIRDLAHRKWEAAGRPAGDGLHFWLEAERELKAERTGPLVAPAAGEQPD